MKRILNIVSGARSGALNIAITVGEYLKQNGYQVETILRKYNHAGIHGSVIIEDNFTIDYILKLAKYIQKANPSVLLVHGYSTHIWSKLAAIYSNSSAKIVHVEHNPEHYTPFRRWLTSKLDKYTAAYICVSRSVALHLMQQGIAKEKVYVIYNGIDLNKFQISKESHNVFTIGMTARFTRQKDQMTLIRAVEYLIRKKNKQIKLLLQGEGKTKQNCIEYVNNQRLRDYILFETGTIQNILPRIDLFVLSTHWEGFGLVLCEAMATGIPIIATNVDGVNEVIEDKKSGFLVPDGDFMALAEKISYCENDMHQEILQCMIKHARKTVKENFSLNNMCESYQTIIEKIDKI